MANARIPLSKIARDPVVAAFLARGERGTGDAFAVSCAPKPVLGGGVAKQIELA